MEKEERTEFRKGDIVINGFAGEGNPILFRDTPLIYAGHMKEYDDFVKALSRLRGG